MTESVLNMLKPCLECGKLSYNYDGYCDLHPSEPEQSKEEGEEEL